MNRLSTYVLIASLALGARALAAASPGWTLAECGAENQARYSKFEQAIRAARPGSTVYVPKPYPQTQREVISDFLFQYEGLHREKIDPSQLPENEERLIRGILASTVTYDLLRVEDWTPMRCGREQRRDFYFLLRVFDVASGAELARVALEATGLLAEYRSSTAVQLAETPAAQRGRLPDPQAFLQQIETAYGIKGEMPQYVSTWGLNCTPTAPCLAFRDGKSAYVFYDRSLFQIAPDSTKLRNGRDVGTPSTNRVLLKALAPEQRLVTLGGPMWTIALQVKPPVRGAAER